MDMKHIFRKGKDNNQPTFIMFHGTGGDETDLIPVALRLNPDYNVLSVKGNVSEGGMARFFKRVGEGQYDWEDLAERSDELNAFLKEVAEHYNFDLDKAVLVGFSNGSNMAINLLLREDTTFAKALLFAPLYPTDIENVRDLSNMTIFLSMGTQDPIVPVSESERVIDIFKRSGAKVETHWTVSHGITEAALNDAAKALED